jgi:hypothetical protein
MTAVVVALGCGILIGACGSSGHRSTASTDPELAVSRVCAHTASRTSPIRARGRLATRG